ncbi:MAG: tetratricopeptide repeat protein [Rubrivivax sp.]|nr:tetratricopeptide repeat protein [Rubrivivax sp.]
MSPTPAPAAARAAEIVRHGFDAQQRGDTTTAEAAYLQALQLAPAQPDALQLLGSLARTRGDEVAAETWWRRSLQAHAGQPHVWNNLGNLLLRTGRPADALPCFEQALTLKADYTEAHYNRARTLHAQGRAAAAATALQRAIAMPGGPRAAMLQLAAQLQGDAGRIDEALATLDTALQLAPERAALHHNRAVLLQRCHRHAQALQAHETALRLGLDQADAHYNHGNTLQSLGRLHEALQAYRSALARDAGHALAHYDLARLRWRLGHADFDAELRQAITTLPNAPQLPALLGHLLWRAERHADAAAAYREALRRAPQEPRLHDGLGRCLVRLGEVEPGLAAHRQAVTLAPDDAELHANFAASLLIARRGVTALGAAEAACRLAPHDQYALALLGLAWRMNGDPREAWLNDVSRFVRVCELPPPAGWVDMASFNIALAAELATLHGDRQPPIDQTLRHGTQTLGDIFEQSHPLVDALKARITEAVADYIATLPSDPAHPFLKRRGSGWRYADSWSSRLGRHGLHTDHVHPHGWVSSAYYVQVPASCADASRRDGWLRFGQPDIDTGLAGLVRREVAPAPGRLVLFPSMFWHGTTPLHDDAARLTIAFDVMPL